MPNLFVEGKNRQIYPNRPLGQFSNFVVEKMPEILTAIHHGQASDVDLYQEITAAMKQFPYEQLNALVGEKYKIRDNFYIQHSADVAGLDLKMAESALLAHRLVQPGELGRMVEAVSKATLQPAVLTYEEIIYLNPLNDRRLFMAGDIGRTESDFYRGHELIEDGFNKVKKGVQEAMSLIQTADPEQAAQQLVTGDHGLQEAISLMRQYHTTMSKEHFNIFRKYLGSHPFRGLVGPSGNFTPELPVVEMLAYGDLLSDEYYDYMKAHRMYFPRRGRAEMSAASRVVDQGKSLTQLCVEAGKPVILADAILDTSKKVYTFRNHHFAAVKENIPQAVEGRLKGTAGEDPGTFLVGRRDSNRVRAF